MLEVAFDFESVAILLVYPKYADHRGRLHMHQWMVEITLFWLAAFVELKKLLLNLLNILESCVFTALVVRFGLYISVLGKVTTAALLLVLEH